MHIIFEIQNSSILYFLTGTTVSNNIIIIITNSLKLFIRMYVAQASSYFKCLAMHHATPILTTEALRLAANVQLF